MEWHYETFSEIWLRSLFYRLINKQDRNTNNIDIILNLKSNYENFSEKWLRSLFYRFINKQDRITNNNDIILNTNKA